MDKLREEFEEWFKKGMVLDISECNETVVRLMWKSWQASRASIVVELPEYRSAESYQSAGYNEALDDCDSALHSIGLSIKGE